MYELKKEGYKFKKRVKLILGCDEESGWGCIDHYKKRATLPEVGFSPDAEFPVIYAEKGLIHLKYRFKKEKPFSAFGGIKANVVCDYAKCEGDFSAAKATDKIKLKKNEAEAFGVAAHGSAPEKGDNAIKYLTAFLEENGFLKAGLYNSLFSGAKGATELSDETGSLTFSPNIIETDDEFVYFTVDVRYPATLKRDLVEEKLSEVGKYEILYYHAPLFAEKDGEPVKTLASAYKEVTGEEKEPIAIGGGTYARALKNGVAFGPALKEEESSSIHMPNEFIYLDTLEKMTEIYYLAIKRLCT